jgi:hypothetical protein
MLKNKISMQEILDRMPATHAAHARANRSALLEHARMGRSVPTERDGKVVWITPVEIFASYGLDEFGRPNNDTPQS